jgi:hypothetical protein
MVGRRLHDISQTDRRDRSLRRGSRGSTVTRTCQATGETVLVPPRNRWSRVGHITGETGKVADDETVEDGLVVAKNRSNVRGAKEPCCNATPVAEGRQGRMIKTPSSLQDLKSGDIRQGEDGGGRSECVKWTPLSRPFFADNKLLIRRVCVFVLRQRQNSRRPLVSLLFSSCRPRVSPSFGHGHPLAW